MVADLAMGETAVDIDQAKLRRWAAKWLKEVPSRPAKYGASFDEMSNETKSKVQSFYENELGLVASSRAQEQTDRHTERENQRKQKADDTRHSLIKRAAERIAKSVGGKVQLSEASGSAYVVFGDKKIRISDHEPRPTHEKLMGTPYREIAVGDGYRTAQYRISSESDIDRVVKGIKGLPVWIS